ncbi:hypothetical protein KOW79_004864, partial [Hemibagrus wyckioides]
MVQAPSGFLSSRPPLIYHGEGGMPAPEQNPMSEEGLLLPIKDQFANHNMESESAANNILASVKEQ